MTEAIAAFDPEFAAVSRARGFVRDTLSSWRLEGGHLSDDAVLLVSELVTNAVLHAGTRLEVRCTLDDGELEVGVADLHPSRALPDAPHSQSDSAERGRGLLLPTALASSWGVTYTSAAKTVWFRLPAGRGGQAGAPSAPTAAITGSHPVLPRNEPVTMSQRELGKLDFGELIRHTVETARDALGADAAYVLIADEEGELQVRGAVGVEVPAALASPPGAVLLAAGGKAPSQVSVPFLVDGRVTGVLGAAAATAEKFSRADEIRLQQVADRVAMSLERLRLSELERVRRGRVAFLAEASELLSSTLDQRQAIALAAQLMVPRLAAWCAVFLSDAEGVPRVGYVWHADEAMADGLTRLLDAIPPPVLSSVASFPDASHGSRSWSLALPAREFGKQGGLPPEAAVLAADSAWCFPLTARGRVLGALAIGRPRADSRWHDPPSRESLELAEDLARRAALALDNARLYERQRMTSHALQRSLLPPRLPHIPRVDLAATHEAAGEANEVGGDFYDVFAVGEHRWRFAIGDVCGTGPEAAAVTGLARHTLRILATEGHGIADVVSRLNGLILREDPRSRFITLLHGEIEVPPSGPLRVSLVCAGHPLPLLLRAGGTGLPAPAAEPQMLLGVVDECSFGIQEVELSPGDTLLSVTDGITERRSGGELHSGGQLLDDDEGLARLLGGCRGLTAGAVVARVQRAVGDFSSAPPGDDMAILVIRAL